MIAVRSPRPAGPDGFPAELPDAMAFVGAEGGVGVTVSAIRMAALNARSGHDVVLVDLTGDIAVVLDTPRVLAGVADLMRAGATPSLVRSCLVRLSEHVRMLPQGTGELPCAGTETLAGLWDGVAALDMPAWIDAGRGTDALERLGDADIARIVLTRPTRSGIERTRDLLRFGIDVVACAATRDGASAAGDVEAAIGMRVDELPWHRDIAHDADRRNLLAAAMRRPGAAVAAAGDGPESAPRCRPAADLFSVGG